MPLDAELLATFLAEAKGLLARLRSADIEDRRVAAHSLKGLSRLVEVPQLEPLARELEARAADDEFVTQSAAQIEAMLAVIADTGQPPVDAGPPELAGALEDFNPEEQAMLRRFFLEEAQEHLEGAQRTLLALARENANRDLLAELFRTLHTVKGAAGTVGLAEVTEAAHMLEDRIEGLTSIEPELIETMLSGIDTLRSMIEGGTGLLDRLKEDLRPTVAPAPSEAEPAKSDRREVDRRTEVDRRGERQVLRVEVARVDELMDAVGDLVFDRTRIERRVIELRALAQDLARTRHSFRDAVAKLRHEANPLADRLAEVDGDIADTARRLERALGGLNDEAEGLRRTATVLQEGLTRVRMMPLRWLFARLERLVRDTAREEGKQIALETLGEATELDKSVVDQIGDPLLQLLRNAVAHGIEDPAERLAQGKPAVGRVTVEARQKGEFVYIDVTDDGRGIDPAVVRERLAQSGRLSRDAAASMSDDDAVAAIFERGFSTRPAADRLAGRGIGLDVVRESLARLGGSISVGSQPHILTIFTIRLPLTTAIAQALLFKVGGNVYALPAAHVLESAQVTAPLGRTVQLREGNLPLVDLHLLLNADPPLTRRRTVIALSFGDRKFAITCDKVVGPRQIVVKSLGPLLKPLPLYAGATISGAGKVQLILDLAELAAQLGRDRPAFPRFDANEPAAERRAHILVADDSRSVREAVTLILAQAGYRVDAVPDGWEAWEALQDGAYDLLLTDLEMPRLAGYELIAKLRRDVELRSMPVLVISSRGAQPNRARAEAAGAQGFIPKPINRRAIVDRVAEALRRSR